MNVITRLKRTVGLCGLAFVFAAGMAHAQSDSVLYVAKNGNPLLRVNSNGNVGIATPSPTSRFQVDSGRVAFNGIDGFVAAGVFGQGAIPAAGSGVRMMWYPRKAAFRVGGVGTTWDDASIGTYSFSAGLNTTASGVASVALGGGAVASGASAVALGNNSLASGDQSFAFGIGSSATAVSSIAFFGDATAVGAIAMGISATASADGSVALGAWNNASGTGSVALGTGANAIHTGSFVYADSYGTLYSTQDNQFMVRATGGTVFYTDVLENNGVELFPGGGAWANISDRNRKENFVRLDGEDVLARLSGVAVTSWNYKTQDRLIRHIGPMAQDLHAAFGMGESELHINTIDIDGINMAAVQAVALRTDVLRARVATLESENAALRERLDRIEAALESLAKN